MCAARNGKTQRKQPEALMWGPERTYGSSPDSAEGDLAQNPCCSGKSPVDNRNGRCSPTYRIEHRVSEQECGSNIGLAEALMWVWVQGAE